MYFNYTARTLATLGTLLMLNIPSALGATQRPATPAAPVPAVGKSASSAAQTPDGRPTWAQGVFMEVFVRAYQDSDGDGIGDLKGLTQRLDYLQALGIRGLWLMPITRSADRDHGYAITDFRDVEPDYGTLADMDALLREAHRRGIRVVLDYILNHSAREHPWFQAALADPASPWRDWFVWQTPAPADLKDWDIWGKNAWTPHQGSHYFGTFGPHMPDFNLRNPAVVQYHLDSLSFWMDRGVDGFRLDAVPHLIENSAKDWNDQPESRALTARFSQWIRQWPGQKPSTDGTAAPSRYVVCEATASPTVYASPEVCGSAFGFGLERRIIQAARQPDDSENLAALARHFEHTPLNMATILANHDIFAGRRVWDQVEGDEVRYKLAAATYLLLPGTPFIYYGEEIGMAGAPGPGDEPLRAPMSWTADLHGFSASGRAFRALSPNAASHNVAAQQRDPQSILQHYRRLIALRNSHAALQAGDYRHAFTAGGLMGFQRHTPRGERLLVLINHGPQAWSAQAQGLPPGLTPTQRLKPLLQTRAAMVHGSAGPRRQAAALRLPPQSLAVFRLD